MRGLMMDRPLLISSLLEHAAETDAISPPHHREEYDPLTHLD